ARPPCGQEAAGPEPEPGAGDETRARARRAGDAAPKSAWLLDLSALSGVRPCRALQVLRSFDDVSPRTAGDDVPLLRLREEAAGEMPRLRHGTGSVSGHGD